MIAVFAYHSVSHRDYLYAITPEEFEQQLLHIKKKFKVISTAELRNILESGHLPKKNLALITFDDGLRDNYTEAFPILKKLYVPATIFLATGSMESSFATKAGAFEMLHWQEAKEMSESGLITFGSHTHTHPDLAQMNQGAIEHEFVTSNQVIKENLGLNPKTLAYPKGRYNDLVKSTAAQSFALAFADYGVISALSRIDLFALPRIMISRNISSWKFKLFAQPLYWKFRTLIR